MLISNGYRDSYASILNSLNESYYRVSFSCLPSATDRIEVKHKVILLGTSSSIRSLQGRVSSELTTT